MNSTTPQQNALIQKAKDYVTFVELAVKYPDFIDSVTLSLNNVVPAVGSVGVKPVDVKAQTVINKYQHSQTSSVLYELIKSSNGVTKQECVEYIMKEQGFEADDAKNKVTNTLNYLVKQKKIVNKHDIKQQARGRMYFSTKHEEERGPY